MRIFGIILSASLLGFVVQAEAQTPSSTPANYFCQDSTTGAYKSVPPCAAGTVEVVYPTIKTPTNCAVQFYPAESKRNREQGKTVITYSISVTGEPINLKVKESSGFPRLDEGAVKCARAKRYNPATQAGVAVEIPWEMSVTWTMF